jgi:spore coat protein H
VRGKAIIKNSFEAESKEKQAPAPSAPKRDKLLARRSPLWEDNPMKVRRLYMKNALGCLVLLGVMACDGNPNAPDETDLFFDETVLHQVDITVSPENLAALDASIDTDIRVSANIVYDQLPATNIGIRLKGFIGSVQDLSEKPGFSLKLNEFVQGQDISGVKKFTLDNAIQDPSFMSAHVGYELWRRAGTPAQRTAYARVTFNGEYFGVYVVNESVTSDFLEKNFADGAGNLYEGIFHVDVTDVDTIDLDTNEDINDRADLRALAEVINNTPDEQFVQEVSALVDLDAFLSYWAMELLTYHWDGYAEFPSPFSNQCCSPNNYYAYHEPTRNKIIFMPHGIDQLFQDINVDVTDSPAPLATLATRLFDQPEIRQQLADKIRVLLVTAWDAPVLEARMDAAFSLIQSSVLEFDRNPNFDPNSFEPRKENVRQFLQNRPQIVLDQLEAAGL